MNRGSLLAYGALGAPLAMAALPVYIMTPKLYGEEFGLGLALTGTVLFLSRLVDTAQDPWLGRLADYMHSRTGGGRQLLAISGACLSLAFIALFNPPDLEKMQLVLWLGMSLILVYTAHSALNISYLAWGARASDESSTRTRLVASREGFGLAGVILATLLPALLTQWLNSEAVWWFFSLAFVTCLIPALWVLQRHVSLPVQSLEKPASITHPLRHRPFRRLATLFMLNGLAIAVAATVSLFYIADVLGVENQGGLLLALYFVSGAISLPFWIKLANRIGRCRAWLISGVLSIVGFIWIIGLGSGDTLSYAIICAMTGATLGADLALPAALAADIIPVKERSKTAGYFGIWSLINKGVLAIAAGICLPLLALLGYQPGTTEGLLALTLVYAAIPCALKLTTVLMLWRWQHSLEIKHAT